MKTPPEILEKFEQASLGLVYGTVSLSLFIKQGRSRYVVAREESYLPKDSSVVTADCKEEENGY
jgi:hypothetical protein